jgi:hypothetical protein
MSSYHTFYIIFSTYIHKIILNINLYYDLDDYFTLLKMEKIGPKKVKKKIYELYLKLKFLNPFSY